MDLRQSADVRAGLNAAGDPALVQAVEERIFVGALDGYARALGVELKLPEIGAVRYAGTINAATRRIASALGVAESEIEFPSSGEELDVFGPKLRRTLELFRKAATR